MKADDFIKGKEMWEVIDSTHIAPETISAMMEEYANQRVILALRNVAYMMQGADKDVMIDYIESRIKNLKQEI